MKDSLYPMLEIGKRVVTKRFVIFLPLLARKLERLLGLNYPRRRAALYSATNRRVATCSARVANGHGSPRIIALSRHPSV
jgi:hypothetical protein